VIRRHPVTGAHESARGARALMPTTVRPASRGRLTPTAAQPWGGGEQAAAEPRRVLPQAADGRRAAGRAHGCRACARRRRL